MTVLNILSGPVIGGIIGYFTNYIAIKMVFRPFHPVKIGRFTLPFTPGIIPKRKDEIAGVLGETIARQFFTEGDIEDIFLSEDMCNAVSSSITDMLYRQDTDNTLSKIAENAMDEEQYTAFKENIKDELLVRIQKAISKVNVSDIMTGKRESTTGKKQNGGFFKRVLSSEKAAILTEPIGEQIQAYLINNSEDIIKPILSEELDGLSNQQIEAVLTDLKISRSQIEKIVSDIYTSFMKENRKQILKNFDIAGITEKKVKELEPQEIEKLVYMVIKKEMRAVVILGGVLGVMIGIINIFI